MSSSALCNPTSSSPSAILVSAPNPTGGVRPNGTLTVSYELALVNYTTAMGRVPVYVPSAFAIFPLTPAGNLQIFLSNRTVAISNAGWTNPTATNTTATKVLPVWANFSGTGTAKFSSQKLAVMAGAAYNGQLAVEFRWQWTLVASPTATSVNSSWTTPGYSSTSATLPSIFYPAPYVSVVGLSNWPAPVGSNFTVTLGGAVASTGFRVILEYPSNGTKVSTQFQNTTSGISTFPAWVLLLKPGTNSMASGNYIIQLHDVCNAIARNVPIGVTNETVTCGPHTVSPAALSIPAPNPSSSQRKNGGSSSVSASLEVAVVNYTSSLGRVTVYLPSSRAVMPTLSGGAINVTVPAATLNITGSGWSSPVTGSYKSNSRISFDPGQPAHFSTAKLAVMASTSYNGQVTLAFRGQWSISGQTGSWTVPSYSWTGTYLPSIFYPAPFVAAVHPASSAVPGSNYTVGMSGAVRHTEFRMVIEYPNNGTEIRHQDEYTAPNATFFNGTILLDYPGSNTPIAAGSYIVHVHDVCDAIIHSISVSIGSSGGGSGGIGGKGLGAPVGGAGFVPGFARASSVPRFDAARPAD